MKRLRLILDFVRSNFAALFLIAATFSLSFYSLLSFSGEYRYLTYTREIFENCGFLDACYFYFEVSDMYAGRQVAMGEMEDFVRGFSETFPDAEFVSYRYGFDYDNGLNIRYYPDGFISRMRLDVSEGRWLMPGQSATEAVVGGKFFDDTRIGDEITLYNGLKAVVVGRLKFPVVPGLSAYGTYLSASDLFTERGSFVILNSDSTAEKGRNLTLGGFIPRGGGFPDGLTDYLGERGKIYSYDTIMANTERNIRSFLRYDAPFPAFMTALSVTLAFTLIAVMNERNRGDMAKYYIIGCGKGELTFIVSAAVGGAMIIPGAANIILALCEPELFGTSDLCCLFDFGSVFPAVVLLIVVFAAAAFHTAKSFAGSPIMNYLKSE